MGGNADRRCYGGTISSRSVAGGQNHFGGQCITGVGVGGGGRLLPGKRTDMVITGYSIDFE